MTDEEVPFKALSQLTGLMKEVLTITANKKMRKETPFEKQLRLYESTFAKGRERSFANHHAPLFIDLFLEYRSLILNIVECDEFLCNEDRKVEIWFGIDKPEVKKCNIKLPLSVCYMKAKRLYDNACDRLTGNEEKDNKIYESTDYTACDEMKYFLLVNIYNSLALLGDKYSKDLDKLDVMFNQLKPETVDEHGEIRGSTIASVMRGAKTMMPEIMKRFGNNESSEKAAEMFDIVTDVVANEEFFDTIGTTVKEMNPKGKSDFRNVLDAVIDKVLPSVTEKMVFSDEELPEGVTVKQQTEEALKMVKEGMDVAAEITDKM